MSHDSQRCREVWAALEKYPALSVQSVVIASETYRWSCVVRVPWDRYGKVASTLEDVAELASRLAEYEAEQRAAAAIVAVPESCVIAHPSGEVQLGLF